MKTMQEKVIIETMGTITKKEDLVFYENDKNVLAFETAHAYPGYNSIVPQDYDPNSIFLITKEQYLTEEVFVCSQNIRKRVQFTFNSAIAFVNYQNQKYPAIRIKGLKNYAVIPEIINAYVEEGILFQKKKNFKTFSTLIQVKKSFYLESIGEGYYKDLNDTQMVYFETPDPMEWDAFEKVILDIKYNNPSLNFDAALSLFYRAEKVVFAVRIFKEDINSEELELLKEQFYKRIK